MTKPKTARKPKTVDGETSEAAMRQAAKFLNLFALERRYDEIEADLRKLLRKHQVTWRHGEGIIPWKDSPKALLDCNQAFEAVYALRESLSAPPSDREMEIRHAQLWGNILGQTLQRLRLRSLTDREAKRTRNSGDATADKWAAFHPEWIKGYEAARDADRYETSRPKLARVVAANTRRNPNTGKPFKWQTVSAFLKRYLENCAGG